MGADIIEVSFSLLAQENSDGGEWPNLDKLLDPERSNPTVEISLDNSIEP